MRIFALILVAIIGFAFYSIIGACAATGVYYLVNRKTMQAITPKQ